MASKLSTEVIERKEHITVLTSTHFSSRNGVIVYDKETNSLQIFIKSENADGDVEENMEPAIDCNLIAQVTARSYSGRSGGCNLLIVMKSGEAYMISFEVPETLVAWESCLRALIAVPSSPSKPKAAGTRRGSISRQDSLKPAVEAQPQPQDPQPPKPSTSAAVNSITSVKVLKPRQGMLCSLQLELSGCRQEVLDVPMVGASSDDCRRLVRSFIEKNMVNPRESSSMYRYVRSIVQRYHMESETQAILREIADLRFDQMVMKSPGDAAGKDIEKDADARLSALVDKLHPRIGSSGVGAEIVIKILSRSIEKTRLINSVSAKMFDAQQEQQVQTTI